MMYFEGTIKPCGYLLPWIDCFSAWDRVKYKNPAGGFTDYLHTV